MAKNRHILPAKGTVLNLDVFFNAKWKANEKISELIKIMANEMVENEKAKAKNINTSPNPKAFLKSTFSLNLA